ncbi:helix-turn-helix domain-containing protein, partial [Clostridioides difficile]|nr:helix-turn-helix transcriptional regulator [Clostridioides difficile]
MYKDESNIFSKRLREEREELGLMQKEMANKLSLPANTYNGYETGKRSPALDVV